MAQNKMKQTSRRNVEIQVLSKFNSLLIQRNAQQIIIIIYLQLLVMMYFTFIFRVCCLVRLVPPKIMPIQSMTNMLKEGMRAAISCQILEGDLPMTFRFERNGKAIIGTG